jgi:hypothetical protein
MIFFMVRLPFRRRNGPPQWFLAETKRREHGSPFRFNRMQTRRVVATEVSTAKWRTVAKKKEKNIRIAQWSGIVLTVDLATSSLDFIKASELDDFLESQEDE